MSDRLVYQTSDQRFADKAVEAMTEAGIPCYWTGRSSKRDLGAGISIFVKREEDYARANTILLELGAAPDEPIKLPSRRVLFILALLAAAVAIYVATSR